MTQLSPHFTLAELTRSQAAARIGLDNTPPAHIIENLKRLAVTVLEPIRAAAKGPIVVTSGYRCLTLNTLIGGSQTSDHMLGLAADIHAVGMPLYDLGRLIRRISPTMPLKQCIEEFGAWVHVSASEPGVQPKREFLTATRGEAGVVYQVWRNA